MRMSWNNDRLELEVSDSGCGPVAGRNGRVGHGLLGIRERAALHHGSVQVGARRGGGYRVRASLPLLNEETG